MSTSTTSTNGVHHGTDEAIDALYAWMPPQPTPQSCPEALFSCTVRGTLDGHETLLTVRGMTAAEFTANLQQVRGLLDPPAQTPPPIDATPQCPQHGALKKSTKHGGYYCPRKLTDDTWCPTKAK